MTRVVGVTIDDDGRVIIRGLGGNYNRILLNEFPIPGVDPDVPSVNLDIFPADVVSNLAVVKTPRPDLPGNFAGGLSAHRDLELSPGVHAQGGRVRWRQLDEHGPMDADQREWSIGLPRIRRRRAGSAGAARPAAPLDRPERHGQRALSEFRSGSRRWGGRSPMLGTRRPRGRCPSSGSSSASATRGASRSPTEEADT